jgi:hypothetical protein
MTRAVNVIFMTVIANTGYMNNIDLIFSTVRYWILSTR